MDLSEFELIGRIAGQAPTAARFETGIGDDAAVIRTRGRIVTSVDTAVAGVHFGADRPAGESARKAVASAVSDLAAMGLGRGETELLVALGAPPGADRGYLEGLADGVLAAAAEFGAQLAGGDVVSSPVVFLSVTAIAHAGDGIPLVTRAGARPGDLVAVTGAVGGAAAGLELLKGLKPPDVSRLTAGMLVSCQTSPDPDLESAPLLARAGATAMIDVSDGLAADLGHLAEASGVAIRVEGPEVPLLPGVIEVAGALGLRPLEFALTGGEDYILALTIPPDKFRAADDSVAGATGFELAVIGKVAAAGPGGPGVSVFLDGGELDLGSGGHDHFGGRKPAGR